MAHNQRRSSAPLPPMAVDYSAPLDATTLIVEVAAGAFAFKNKIKATSIKLLWEKLCEFAAATLKAQKGVLLPNLGTFKVGPCVGEAKKKIRPAFALLEGRYGGVSQERARYAVGGRAPVIQPSYNQLATQAGIHRGATQRLVAELLQRLGVHILSGRPVRVEFPGLGTMLTNRGGRFEFLFDPIFMEHFELEQYAILREMDVQTDGDQAKAETASQRPLSPYHLSPREGAPPSVAPLRAAPPSGPQQQQQAPSSRPHSARQQLLSAHHQPFRGELLNLYRLCKLSDRIQAGTVPRPTLEVFLHQEARGLLSQVDGTSVLDLLTEHSYGKTKKLVLYTPFLHALGALASPPPPQPQQEQEDHHHAHHHHEHHTSHSLHNNGSSSAHPPPDPHQPQPYASSSHQPPAGPQDVSEASFSNMLPPNHAQPPPNHPAPALQQLYPPVTPGPYAPGPDMHQQQQPLPYAGGYAHGGQGGNFRPASAAPSEPSDYLHYAQQQLSPRSRTEYDLFNKMHFERLHQMRGPGFKRALTPKVGEEPLNVVEYQALRLATPGPALAPPRAAAGGTPGVRRPPLFLLQAGAGGTPSSAPPHLGLYAAEAAARATSPLPHHLASPPRSFRYADQVGLILQDPPPPPPRPITQPSPALQPPPPPAPRAAPPPAPISYHDIERADGENKGRLKVELASELQQGWQRQIDERQEFERAVEKAQTSWPYGPTHMPNDKRPVSAISRPPTASPRRMGYGDRA